MRIALDCRTVTSPKTGDRTYALNLSRALAAVDRENEYRFYTWERTTLTESPSPRCRGVYLPANPRWAWTPIVFPNDLRNRSVDLAHVQYLVPPVTPCPVITTIHDVAFRRFPKLFPLKHRLLLNALIPAAIHHAAMVITGSEATKRDLIELFDAPEEKIAVTPYAADASFRPRDRDLARAAVKERFGIEGPYVLSVGVIQPRKNLPRLVRAFSRIARKVPHRLVLVGKEGWASEELRRAVNACGPGREPLFTGYVADADLPDLYAGADLFVYPSLYEGFGLPVLEAMACGTAVVTSTTSSLPEVAGDAASLVEPTDVKALGETMLRLLQDPSAREELAAKGLARAKTYSWERTARETIQVYERVARSNIPF
jgi:glycosyltransferase involved in cell wall biosynthesis